MVAIFRAIRNTIWKGCRNIRLLRRKLNSEQSLYMGFQDKSNYFNWEPCLLFLQHSKISVKVRRHSIHFKKNYTYLHNRIWPKWIRHIDASLNEIRKDYWLLIKLFTSNSVSQFNSVKFIPLTLRYFQISIQSNHQSTRVLVKLT